MQVNNKLDTRPVVDIWPVVALMHKYAIYRLSVSFDVYGFSTTISDTASGGFLGIIQ